eukprot:1335059-Ditylum_brightwellii.AAC.1
MNNSLEIKAGIAKLISCLRRWNVMPRARSRGVSTTNRALALSWKDIVPHRVSLGQEIMVLGLVISQLGILVIVL